MLAARQEEKRREREAAKAKVDADREARRAAANAALEHASAAGSELPVADGQ